MSERAVRTQKYEADFLRHLRSGDTRAWDHLVDDWGPRLYGYLAYHVRDLRDMEALLSEIMIALMHEITRFEDHHTLPAWIYTVAYRKIRSDRRCCRPADNFARAAQLTEPDRQSRYFYQAIFQLPEAAQQAIWLRYREGLAVEEIADVLGCSTAKVETMIKRVPRTLYS
jgi:RNA polymerase sigma-70 factor, ECF subfamily